MPQEYGIHGIHGTAINAHTPERTIEFAESVFHSDGRITEDGDRAALRVGNDKFGNVIEVKDDFS